MSFQKNVFINCPFDDAYLELRNAAIFCLKLLGYNVLISETKNSNDQRISEIKKLIGKSKYGIHDLSRIKCNAKGEIPRFNMPSCFFIKKFLQKRKKFILILSHVANEYKIALSDISGQDIKVHHDKPSEIIRCIRDWFSVMMKKKRFPLSEEIYLEYLNFTEALKLNFTGPQINIAKLTVSDYIKFLDEYLDD